MARAGSIASRPTRPESAQGQAQKSACFPEIGRQTVDRAAKMRSNFFIVYILRGTPAESIFCSAPSYLKRMKRENLSTE
jgi:hypothetical protein